METQYWATKDISEIAVTIEQKFEGYRKWLQNTGYADRIKATYNMFYGIHTNGTLHIQKDKETQLSSINVNHFKSLVRRLHILVTENKLAFSARSKNSDTKSSIESDLARGIVEYYNDEKSMNSTISESVLGALLLFEYYVYCPWDYTEGFELSVDGGQVIKSGDQKFITLSPFDVAKNTVSRESPWFIIREKVNKYNLAAQYPNFAYEITSESLQADIDGLVQERESQSEDDEDYVYKYTLVHTRTPSLASGRMTEVCAGQVLADGVLKYNKLPLFRISAGDMLQTVFKDSPTVELVPLQEALNLLMSGTVTNNMNNARQLIWSSDPNLTLKKLSDGQTLVTSATPPTALNLTGSAAENFKMIDLLKADEQLLSGVNDVARGNPSSNLKSGTSLAVVLAQAIQYVSELQKNYAALASDIASCLVDNIKQFQTEEMTAYIVGSSKKSTIKRFKAEDLMDVERITCSLGNPLMQGLAGRQEMMQNWMQYGVMKDPKQIISFLSTGNLDAQIESDFSDALLIADENEMLRKGEMPLVMLTDLHNEHIPKHNKLLSDRSVREDPILNKGVMDHMQAHIDISRTVPPDLAAALSGQPLPPPAPPPGQPPLPGEQPNPTMEGARMPDVPEETPAPMAEGYNNQLTEMPEEMNTQEQF